MFNDDDSAYMHITPGSAGNRQKFTFSCWIKKCSGGTEEIFIAATNTTNYTRIGFEAGDEIKIFEVASGSTAWEIQTQQKFRDFGAWYNIVVAFDTTQGTAANRIKLYVNGTRVPASSGFGDETYPDEDYETQVTNSVKHWLGISADGSNGPYDGYMAEVVLINDAQLTPTSFGEFNEDSPTIWQPINVSGLTFGTNGFYLDFEDSANLGNDANGGTDLTEVNLAATDQATDTPTNNFATLNPLNYSSVSKTYAEGNTALTVSNGDDWNATQSNFSVRNGKWYWEVKVTAIGNFAAIGVGFNPFNSNATAWLNSTYLVGEQTGSYGWRNNGARPQGGGALSTYTTNDILSIAMDMDNQKVYFAKNGTWEDSGDPTSGATGTGSIGNLTANKDYLIVICPRGSAMYCNFGNPAFTISSSNADADGYGNFEYAVPSGYFALCTKNLAEYG